MMQNIFFLIVEHLGSNKLHWIIRINGIIFSTLCKENFMV